MKFTAEMFPFDIEDSDAGLKYLAHQAAQFANAKLEQWLADGLNCDECGESIYCHECAERRLCEAAAKFLDKPKPVTL